MSEENNIPQEYKPIGAWGYVGYQILFALPIVGFIVALVFALGGTENKNLKNYARSYFAMMLLAIIFILIGLIVVIISGAAIGTTLSSYYY